MQKTHKASPSKPRTKFGEIPDLFGTSDPFYIRHPKGALGFALRIISFVLGVVLLIGGLAEIALGSCHGGGGFCAGSLNAPKYVGGVVACFFAGLFLARAFTVSYKKMLAAGLSISGIVLLWIALIESHI